MTIGSANITNTVSTSTLARMADKLFGFARPKNVTLADIEKAATDLPFYSNAGQALGELLHEKLGFDTIKNHYDQQIEGKKAAAKEFFNLLKEWQPVDESAKSVKTQKYLRFADSQGHSVRIQVLRTGSEIKLSVANGDEGNCVDKERLMRDQAILTQQFHRRQTQR